MSLWKRGQVYWSYVYVKSVRYHKSTGTGNRRQAELCELEFKKELHDRLTRPPQSNPEMLFSELAATFIKNVKVRPHHVIHLKTLLPYFADMPIGGINKSAVGKFRQERHARKKLTVTTVNRNVEVLRHILFWAVDEGILTTNPIARIRMERERRKPRPVLSVAEEQALLNGASKHLREIIIAALDTGMRRGELLSQLWEHVDFARRLLTVTKSKTAEGESREIPFTARLLAMLSARRQPSGLIFTFQKRAILAVKTAWKTALAKSAIRRFRFHDTRHTFNTRLMEAGVMQEVRKALMGHSSGEDVNSMYTHVEFPMKRRAIEALEAWYAEQQRELQKGETQQENEKANGSEPETPPAGTAELLPAGTGSHQAADGRES